MEFYLYAVLILDFLQENITPITIIAAAFIALVGFFIGWLVGHIRNNATTRALMNALSSEREALEHVRWQLKNSTDHEAFLDHEFAVLTKELSRKQCIIDAYKIGEPADSAQNNLLARIEQLQDDAVIYSETINELHKKLGRQRAATMRAVEAVNVENISVIIHEAGEKYAANS